MTGTVWTKKQEQVLVDFYPTLGSHGCIARLAALGRISTPNNVAAKANWLGLKNTSFTWKGKTLSNGVLVTPGAKKVPRSRAVIGPAKLTEDADLSRAKITIAPTPAGRFAPPEGFVGAFSGLGLGRYLE